ncbi:MAG TPA: META domain-containing protein [Beijerinckiaceae bacterium]|nr:META domain-containing protein [Beijerinckiaceae bacterium]
MKSFRLVLVLAALASATSAGAQAQRQGAQQQNKQQQSNVPQSKRDRQFPVPSSWVATSLNGKPFSGPDRPTLSLDQQYRAKGFGGCNTFSATMWPLREQRMATGPLALTKKKCDKAVMDSEHAFFVAVRTAGQWDFEGVILVIKSQSGELRLERSI